MPAYDSVYLSLSDDPKAILQKMDQFKSSRVKSEQRNQRLKLIPRILLLAGIGCIVFDLLVFRLLLGYSICLLTPVGVACWIAALVVAIILRSAKTLSLPPRYEAAHEIINTLRDDLRPGSSLLGHIDLTGFEQQDKIAREHKDTFGRVSRLYRDQWLSLKLKLYDGNILRLSLVERNKQRMGYWKRSQISGKNKWKPSKDKGTLHELNVRIATNPDIFDLILPASLRTGTTLGSFIINRIDTTGGILNIQAASTLEPKPQDTLVMLHTIYDSLQRKVAA
jgi:hypothetical protein